VFYFSPYTFLSDSARIMVWKYSVQTPVLILHGSASSQVLVLHIFKNRNSQHKFEI